MVSEHTYAIETEDLNFWYGDFQALFDINLKIKKGMITSLIGPSGCGKTTFLRSVNRIVERLGYVRTTGSIKVLSYDIYAPEVALVQLRIALRAALNSRSSGTEKSRRPGASFSTC